MLVLSETLGQDVLTGEGDRAGRLTDMAVTLDDPHPRVTGLVIRRGRRPPRWVPWDGVLELEAAGVSVDASRLGDVPTDADLLFLARDVLDTQVFDVGGHVLARVGDVRLVRDGGTLRVAGVEVGVGAVLRRLGLRRLAGRFRDDPVDWAGIHLASGRGHALELASPVGKAARMTPADLAGLVARLPPARGAEVLGSVATGDAADVLSRQRPRHGGRLVQEMPPAAAAPILSRMPRDDATAALRHVTPAHLDDVLAEVESRRAAGLRRLLAHPPTTAAGLMNPDVVTVPAGADADAVRMAVARAAPHLDALLTVFVVDPEGRVTGSIPPRELVDGSCRVHATPTILAGTPVDAVNDVFARHDVLAIPVVDDDGRLLGAIAVDDLLEELLATRIPRRRRFRLQPWRRR